MTGRLKGRPCPCFRNHGKHTWPIEVESLRWHNCAISDAKGVASRKHMHKHTHTLASISSLLFKSASHSLFPLFAITLTHAHILTLTPTQEQKNMNPPSSHFLTTLSLSHPCFNTCSILLLGDTKPHKWAGQRWNRVMLLCILGGGRGGDGARHLWVIVPNLTWACLTFERSTSVLAWSLSFRCSIFTLRNLQTEKFNLRALKVLTYLAHGGLSRELIPRGPHEQHCGAVTLPPWISFLPAPYHWIWILNTGSPVGPESWQFFEGETIHTFEV